ncbi:MAG TPA: type II toxin-antitoxin system death-on-curing family toxin [Bacillales bacterium]|nr:type II toxin-antitoxin system death-on-curing family toxin [Bacillales bacterium]
MRYLTVKEVEAINQYMIFKYSVGEQVGVKDRTLLESAVFRAQQSAYGQAAYPSLASQAAALFESLAQNHAFHNANKRTAFASLTQFLYYNGYDFEMPTQKAQEDFTVDVVNHQVTFEQIVETIETSIFRV